MNKRKHRHLTLFVLSLTMVFTMLSFTSCKGELGNDDVGAVYSAAIENSLKERFYFWQEYVYNGDESKYNEVNVWAEKDNDSKAVLDDEGNLKDSYIRISESTNSKTSLEYYWGKSKNSESADKERKTLFLTKHGEKTAERFKQDISFDDLLNSELFHQYQLSTRLGEWKNLTANDMDFTIEQGVKKENVHVVELQFKVNDAYTQAYRQNNDGKVSVFEGSSYVAVEIAYDRIAALTIYEQKDLGGISIDSEKYKLQSVYLGPKVNDNNVPKFDAVQTVDEVETPLWKDYTIID